MSAQFREQVEKKSNHFESCSNEQLKVWLTTWMHKFMKQKVEKKEQPQVHEKERVIPLITLIVLGCQLLWDEVVIIISYQLNVSECTSSYSSKWKGSEEQPLLAQILTRVTCKLTKHACSKFLVVTEIFGHLSLVRMLTMHVIVKTNWLTGHTWKHKFTK